MIDKKLLRMWEVVNKIFCVGTFAFFVFDLNLQAQNLQPLQHFKQQAISFQNGEVNLSGTLFLPDSNQKVPAVVILHGSGPDEGLEYKIYGEEFSKVGIATLVFDKRGSGKSGGDWQKRPFEFLAGDALAAVRFLQTRPEINSNKIGLWGISQGGWTAAYAASHSKDVAFVISVAGNAVSPSQQEVWHKDQMYQSLGYSEKDRDTARKFLQMIFDLMVLVDEGNFPLPADVLQSERSGSSIGMNYNPLPDWEKISQPVLLIHGEFDKLSPSNESISRISNALAKNGNDSFTYKIFPKASHTITTNKTGLDFDWDEHFAPDYFKFTTDWILSEVKPKGDSLKLDPSPDFDDSGRFGKSSWFGKAYPQLVLMIIFPIIFLIGLITAIISIFRNRKFLTINIGIICLINSVLLVGFYIFLATSIFPQGMNLMTSYSIPIWQRILPFLGLLSLISTVIWLVTTFQNKRDLKKWQIFISFFAIVFLPWLYYWNLFGLTF